MKSKIFADRRCGLSFHASTLLEALRNVDRSPVT
jgi:hypothetical protein